MERYRSFHNLSESEKMFHVIQETLKHITVWSVIFACITYIIYKVYLMMSQSYVVNLPFSSSFSEVVNFISVGTFLGISYTTLIFTKLRDRVTRSYTLYK